MSRVRSRVFVSSIVGYSRNELCIIQNWIQSNCVNWALLYTYKDGMPELQIFTRFLNALSIKTIQKINPKLKVETSNISFKQIIDSYSKIGKFESSQVMTLSNKKVPVNSSVLQSTIMSAVDSNSNIGMIHWFNYTTTTAEHSMFMRYIADRDDILITSENVDFIKALINEKILHQSKAIRAIILMPHKTKLSPGYYELMDQLRNGFIHNNEYDNKPCVFHPLNVIVYSSAFPSEPEKSIFNIKLKMV